MSAGERPLFGAPAGRLGEVLLRLGVVDEGALERALLAQPGSGLRLATLCHTLGLASERDLARALSQKEGHPALCLSTSVVDLDGLGLIPRVVAERERILPVAFDAESVTLAVADLGERDIFTQVGFATGRRPVPLLAL